MSNQLRIACYNLCRKDIESVFEKIKETKADIILFPEGFYQAEEVDDNLWLTHAMLQEKVIVLGIIGKKHITQKVYLPHGEVLKYHKIHLGKRESIKYECGRDLLSFQYKGINIGVLICSDTHFNELFILERKLGVEVILAPFKSPHNAKRRSELWQKYLPTRAYDYRLSIVANNLTRGTYGGHIGYDAKGKILEPLTVEPLPVYTIEHFQVEAGMNNIDFFLKRKEFRYIKLFLQTFTKKISRFKKGFK